MSVKGFPGCLNLELEKYGVYIFRCKEGEVEMVVAKLVEMRWKTKRSIWETLSRVCSRISWMRKISLVGGIAMLIVLSVMMACLEGVVA